MGRESFLKWLLCFIALYAVVSSNPSTPEPKCTSMKSTKSEKVEYPEVGFYSKGMATLMQHMIGEITEDTALEMSKIVENPEDTHKHISKMLLQHGWILAIFIILILISIGLLIAAIVVFFCRWFNPDKKGLDPTKVNMVITLILIVVCGAVCASGAFVFFITIGDVKTGIDNIGGQLEKTSGYISEFVGNYEKFMNCTMIEQGIELEAMLIDKKKEMAIVTDKFIAELDDTIAKGDALSGSDTKHLKEVQNIKKELTDFKSQVVDVRKSLQGIVDEAGITIQKSLKNLLDVVKKVREGFRKMEQRLLEVIKDNNYYSGAASSVIQWSFLIPLLLCCALAFAFVILLIRFIGNCLTAEKGTKRNLISTISAYVLAITGYAAMLIGVAFFAVAAGCFLVAFASMFLCMGFFDDPDLLVFSAFPSLKMEVGGFTLHNAFVRCKNEYPFFDAINGDKQMAADELETVLNKIMNQDFGESFRTYSIADTLIENIGKEASGNRKVKEYHEALIMMSSRAHRDDLTLEIDDKLEQLMDDIQQRVADQMKTVLDMSPQCESMMNIWDKAGGFICNGVSMPSQGTWMACVICGIGSFAVFHWLFKSTKYLKNYDSDKSSEYSALETTREKKSKRKTRKSKKSTRTPGDSE